MANDLARACGQLLVGGLAGSALSEAERRAFAAGRRGGVVLFQTNLVEGAEPPSTMRGSTAPDGGSDLLQIAALTESVRAAAPAAFPPLIAVDQEGGRFVNIGPARAAASPDGRGRSARR